MSNILKQFIKQSRGVRLSDSEKQSGKELLMTHIASNPVIARSDGRSHPSGDHPLGWQSFSLMHRFFRMWTHPIPIVLSVVLLCGAGTSYAAEDAVPGDPLYPIKIHVNEPVRARLAVTKNAKAKWKTQQLKRRLNEVVTLAENGKLNTTQQADLVREVGNRMKEVQESIKEMRRQGKMERASSTSAFLESEIDDNAVLLDIAAKKHNKDPKEYNELKKEFKKAARELRNGDDDYPQKDDDSDELFSASSSEKIVPAKVLRKHIKIRKGN